MIIAVALAAIILRLSLLWPMPAPVPAAHDEFSYLLAADTFVHGRLTNPPHPMWIFLQTIHVNQHPTYMSKYPPAQGAVLALGMSLGHPWIGVLLSMAGMCAAITWMLQGWFPAEWALLGAVLALVQFAAFNYWVDSYWGGAVAAIGGALVMGSLPRILHRQRPSDSLWLGLGAAILANSRPVEGLLFCLPVAAVLGGWLVSQRSSWQVTVQKIILPVSVILLFALGFVAYYNWRVTHNPLLFPYVVHQREHFTSPPFMWQKSQPPLHFANPQFDAFYNIEQRAEFEDRQTHFVRTCLVRIKDLSVFFCGTLFPAPLLTLPWLLRDRRTRVLIVQLLLSSLGLLLVVPFFMHYAAPLTATVLALIVQGFRHLRHWQHRGRPVGIGVSRVLVVLAVVMVPAHMVKTTLEARHGVSWRDPAMPERARIAARLEAMAGQHLVLVRYSPEHNVHEEWVYNAADIDHAKIVWAREIPGLDLKPLLDYFRGRTVWVVNADTVPVQLQSYQSPAASQETLNSSQ